MTDPPSSQAGVVYHAEVLDLGPVVDFFSPYGRGKLVELSGDDEPFCETERATVVTKLQESAADLAAFSPVAAGFVANLTRVVLPRKDCGPVREFRAASTPTALGRTLLRNPDLDSATKEELIDGMVHEMIHCLIDIIEINSPLIRSKGHVPQLRIESPWTGRKLDLNTYLQACFVWYGLWNLWMQAISAQRSVTALRYASIAARGFIAQDITEALMDFSGDLAPSVVESLENIQRDVRSTSRERSLNQDVGGETTDEG
jgi:HEXXH motif-containing protein